MLETSTSSSISLLIAIRNNGSGIATDATAPTIAALCVITPAEGARNVAVVGPAVGRPAAAGSGPSEVVRETALASPDPSVLRQRLESRGADSAAAIDARLEVAEQELAAQGEFAHCVINADLERAAADLEGIVRAELGLPLDSVAE